MRAPGQYISADSTKIMRTCSPCAANTYTHGTAHRSTSCTTQPACGQGQKMSSVARTMVCGTLYWGTSNSLNGMWVKGGSHKSLKENMGSYASAHVACEKLCAAQTQAGICLFKNGWGGACWYRFDGTALDYKSYYGHSDSRHSASMCGYGETAARSCSNCGANEYQTSSSHRATSCSAQPSCGKGLKLGGIWEQNRFRTPREYKRSFFLLQWG